MGNKIKKGDTVYVLAGKDRGVRGRVLKVMPNEGKAIVENVNFVKRHERARGRAHHQQGGIVQKEAPIDISNLMVVDSKTNQPVRVGFKVAEDGTKTRVAKGTNNSLD